MSRAQKEVAPSLASIGRCLPAHAALSVAVQKDDGQTFFLRRNLEEHIRVVNMRRRSFARRVEPVRLFIVFTRDRCGHRSS